MELKRFGTVLIILAALFVSAPVCMGEMSDSELIATTMREY